ncbi:hypothetical protein IT779_04990 [Nocardia sp. NEAU-351]|uniref:DUF2231 domain-containing protein n=2 Tax=Nocardia bovistercoris TaxID=2785916 RepID=A0A931I6R5_9NOCA|nr:DUF2231 domain-containing protein [Nocardia bovistercoris]MBH0775644.1 hypothetical protein [Nocardia bovistercoris]
MRTIDGLPAHILLVHAVVVLVPLTAVLLALAALWPAARRSLIWLVAALAVVTAVLTPLTVEAGESLAERFGESEAVRTHADLGSTMNYFVFPLVVLAGLLLFAHVRDGRGKPLRRPLAAGLAVLILIAGVAATVQVYRVGESGARAVWGVTASD